jgi:penicillin-binding protein 2
MKKIRYTRVIIVNLSKSIAIIFLLGFALRGGVAPPGPDPVIALFPRFSQGLLPAPSSRTRRAARFVGAALDAPARDAAALQAEINRLMTSRAGAAVVLDVASGKILAQWHLNVAAQRLEQPGSTVKPFVLMELLEKEKINPDQHVICHRPLYIGGMRMDCSHPASVTSLDARDAIAYSCNTYFATVATRLSPGELAEMYKHVGFTSPSGLTDNEAVGSISAPADQGQLQLQALGEWGIEVTPLELLAAYHSLARQKLKSEDLRTAPVFDGLERAVKYGVAHGAQPIGTTAAGKTGTAAGLKTPATHGFFVGYAPADKPEIVVLVYLEHGRGMDAAAIAGPVMTAWWKSR